MDDVSQILDEIRQKMLAELREFRKGACGPHHSDTFAVARDEFLKRLELRILGTAPKRKTEFSNEHKRSRRLVINTTARAKQSSTAASERI